MDNQVINNIKSLGIDMIQTAGSGHPGIVLGAALLFIHYLKIILILIQAIRNGLIVIGLFYLLDMDQHYFMLPYIWRVTILL